MGAAPTNPTTQGGASRQGPLYRQLLQVLKQEILTGVYPVGGQLPTEEALCKRFSVSRHTVREALRQLRADGLVVSRRGAGTTVARPGTPPRYVHGVSSLEELVQYSKETRYDVDTTLPVTADAVLSERLGCKKGERWLRIEGLRYAPPVPAPICWTEVYVRSQFSGITRVLARRQGPIYAWIEDMYGEQIAEIEQVLRARTLPPDICDALGIEHEAPGIEVRRSYKLASGDVAEIAFNFHPADRYTYKMTLRRGPSGPPDASH
ncbi:MAG TPA: GntR family transcriptional regulator [bacterium]